MRYLSFEIGECDENNEGPSTIEALASTSSAAHAAVMAEVRQVMDWAWRRFPTSHGHADDGADWDHDLQVTVEEGGWHAVALTLSASARFLEEFRAEFRASLRDIDG